MEPQIMDLLLQRMDDQKDAIDDLKRTVSDGFAQMNGRVRTTEKELVRIKTTLGITATLGGLVMGWVMGHWAGFKLWLTQ